MYQLIKIILIFFIVFSYSAKSQYDDFGVWSDVTIVYDINKKIEVGNKIAYRTQENSSLTSKYFNELFIKYDLNDFINFAFEYRFTQNRETEGFYNPEHRFAPIVQLVYNLNNEFRIDFRIQYQYEDINYTGSGTRPLKTNIFNDNQYYEYSSRLRLRPRLRYRIDKDSDLNFSYESFLILSEEYNYFNRERFTLEYERELTKRHNVSISYLYQYDINQPNPRTDNIIKLSYTYELKF